MNKEAGHVNDRRADSEANSLQTSSWELPVPSRISVRKADIYLVGFGLRVPNDLTLEALLVLERATQVLAAPPISIDLGLRRVVDLTKLYSPSKPRQVTYRQMVDAVIDAARREPPVVFLTYGSPMFGVAPSHMLLAEGPRYGLQVTACSSASSLDGIAARLNIDPCNGFAIWEASAFVRDQVVVPPLAALLLVQAPFFKVETGSEPGQGMPDGNLLELRDYLLPTYGKQHQVAFVRAEAMGHAARLEVFTLNELHKVQPPNGSSLLIPPVGRRLPIFAAHG